MSSQLPPGPRLPALVQGIGLWNRPLAYLERLRARYGRRFTVRFPLAPPFVIIADPEQVKEVFTASPEVLHPGEGAKVLEPLVGKNSVILLDEGPHMEQRKLMLPAFHGKQMARLSDLMTEVAEREVESWPRDSELPLHPRMQRLTLEIILRTVFGLDPGPRLDALRDRLGEMLAFGDRPISLTPPDPEGHAAKLLSRVGPYAEFVRRQAESDRLIFELIDERRADPGERDDILTMLLEARHEDGSPMSTQELRDELMTMLVAGHETTATSLAWAFERLARSPRVLGVLVDEIDSGNDEYLTATIQETLRWRPGAAELRAAAREAADRGRRLEVPDGRLPRAELLPASTTTRRSTRPPMSSAPSASSTQAPGHLHLDPVRRRPPALHRRELRDGRDADRDAGDARRLRAAAGRRRRRGRAAAQHHGPSGRRRPRGAARAAARSR